MVEGGLGGEGVRGGYGRAFEGVLGGTQLFQATKVRLKRTRTQTPKPPSKRAGLEYLAVSGATPDVLHLHEWQTCATAMLYWQVGSVFVIVVLFMFVFV